MLTKKHYYAVMSVLMIVLEHVDPSWRYFWLGLAMVYFALWLTESYARSA